jgi:hypothetical protein
MLILTPWFYFKRHPPVRIGVYIIENLYGDTYYSYWNGRNWTSGYESAEKAYANRLFATSSPRVKWRGLAKKS